MISGIVSGHQWRKLSPGEQEAEMYDDKSVAGYAEARLLEKGRQPILQALLTVSAKVCFVPCFWQATPREHFKLEWSGDVSVSCHISQNHRVSAEAGQPSQFAW